MSQVAEVERQAARLRRQIRVAYSPELKLLCGLEFFDRLRTLEQRSLEPLLREFLPAIAEAARSAHVQEFLPQDASMLVSLSHFLQNCDNDVVKSIDRESLDSLSTRLTEWLSGLSGRNSCAPLIPGKSLERKYSCDPVQLQCLFVEDYPDIDLEPRGRILTLQVTAQLIPTNATEDVVEVQCSVEQREDVFLKQACASVHASRAYMRDRYGISEKRHYRFRFEIDTTGVRFTGDSLGLAFSIGVICTLSRIEIITERLAVNEQVAFSGALSADGALARVSLEGMKLKIRRAFFSELKFLVLPRDQITESWEYLKSLENEFQNRRLELVGSDLLDQVASDPRLIPRQRVSRFILIAKKIWKARRSALVEAILFVFLLVVLFRLIAPLLDKVPSIVVTRKDGFEVQNRFGKTLWSKDVVGCDSLCANHPVSWAIADLDGAGGKEVVYTPVVTQACSLSGWFYVYSDTGSLIFSRNARICGKYPTDSISENEPDFYEVPAIKIFETNDERIISVVFNKIYPARGYITFWDAKGNKIGWYMLSGTGGMSDLIDIDDDGRMEFLGFAFWNRLDCFGYYVLPSQDARGVSPPYWLGKEGYDLRNVERGNHMRFIAIPLSFDIGRLLNPGFMQGNITFTRLSSNEFKLSSHEYFDGKVIYQIDYYIDRDFRCWEVKLSDNFRKKRNRFIEEGKIENIPQNLYCAMLRDSVRYWLDVNDSTYTTEGQIRQPQN